MNYFDRFKSIFVILSFALIVAFPYYATIFKFDENLVGAEEKVELSFKNIDDYIMQNFPGRTLIVNTKNRFLYETFDISPNSSITKVKDNLFAIETLNYYYHGLYNISDAEVRALVRKLEKFNDYCKKNDKKLLIITTPTKPRYYDGPMPIVDYIISNNQDDSYDTDGLRSYDVFRDELKKTDIYFFDTIEAIDNNKNKYLKGNIPLFYKGAHHWSNYKARLVSFELHDYMRDVMGLKIPHMGVVASKSDIAMPPDSDLFDVLNLGIKSHDDYYTVTDKMLKYESDNLNYIIRGGSFMTGLVLVPITAGYNDTVLMSNKLVFYNNYNNQEEFETYDELEDRIGLIDKIRNADVFIFEVHEINVYNATFGFLDYILEHMEEI